VKEIAITAVNVVNVGPAWHVNVVDEGDADINVAIGAARDIGERLSQQFDVVD
jgi:hypothetical protein